MRIAIEDLHVTLSGRTVVAGVHVLAEDGEIVGVVGPNGSGKSTVLRTVYRHLRPSSGRVVLDGRDVRELGASEAARHVAALPQERGADFELSVREVVAMGRTPYKRPFAGEDANDREIIATALDRVGMTDAAGRGFSTLSGGERQRVLLARAFAQQPDVLVLDEPTNHLDMRHQVELLALLRTHRHTTLVALHDLNAAAAACDRLHVLQAGTVVASGPPRAVLTVDLLAGVFGVRAAVVDHPLTGDPLIAVDHHAPASTRPHRAAGSTVSQGTDDEAVADPRATTSRPVPAVRADAEDAHGPRRHDATTEGPVGRQTVPRRSWRIASSMP